MGTSTQLSPLEQLEQMGDAQSGGAQDNLSPLERLEQMGNQPQPTTPSQPQGGQDELSPLEKLEQMPDPQPPKSASHGIPFGHYGAGFGSNDVTHDQAAAGLAGIGAAANAGIGSELGLADKAKAVYQWAAANKGKVAAAELIARDLGVDPLQLVHKFVKYGKSLFGSEDGK